MTLADRGFRRIPTKRSSIQHQVALRIGQYLVRFAILTLALTGLLALAGVPSALAGIIAFMTVDLGTLIWLERSQNPTRGIPKLDERRRLTRLPGWHDFLN